MTETMNTLRALEIAERVIRQADLTSREVEALRRLMTDASTFHALRTGQEDVFGDSPEAMGPHEARHPSQSNLAPPAGGAGLGRQR